MFSCACILRDQIGFFQAACAKPLKLCDDFLVAELKALKKGLKLALKEGVDYLEIEGNVEILCNLLAGDFALFPFSAKTIARKCFDLMLYFRGINARQAQFQTDYAVRKVAAEAANSKEPRYWQKRISPEIAEILAGDILGRWIPVVVV
ncbi:hypothetical protein L6164_031665 [Bauhinia variegata]|uniref:Uncharacterized protein n=1 Tax=Bauhinia variegata TaxID=167791 RepID=A0ACB9LHR8_BAUVA|nr:hypothetical protein L6164_031665 [Bauhinia variegata]